MTLLLGSVLPEPARAATGEPAGWAHLPDLGVPVDPGPHPYLLFGPGDGAGLQARTAGGGPPQVAWERELDWANRLTTPGPEEFRAEDVRAYRITGSPLGNRVRNLALVWTFTRDHRYLDRLAEVWPAIRDAPFNGMPWFFDFLEWYNRRADALTSLAVAYDLTAADLPESARAAAAAAVESVAQSHMDASGWAWWWVFQSGSNFSGNNGAAIGIAALALRAELGAERTDTWLRRALGSVDNYLARGFGGDGEGFEGPLYGNFGMSNPTWFGAGLDSVGGPDVLGDGRLAHHRRWALSQLLPGGARVNPYNDARYTEQNGDFATWRTSHGPDQPLAAWFWEDYWWPRTASTGDGLATILWWAPPPAGYHPDAEVAHTQWFRDDGLVVARTGYGDGDLFSSFQARRSVYMETGVHHNQDVNNFTLYAHGADLAVDGGYANGLLMNITPYAAVSSSTQGHNGVVIDGVSQDGFVRGIFRRHASTAVVGDPGTLDLSVGDSKSAYYPWHAVERGQRRHLVVRPEFGLPGYLVVADDVRQDANARTYDWFLHTSKDNTVSAPVTAPVGTIRWDVTAPRGAGMSVVSGSQSPLAAFVESFTADYEGIGTHPRLTVRAAGATGLRLVTVLVPWAPGGMRPAAIRVLGDRTGVRVRWPDGTVDVSRQEGAGFTFVRRRPDGTRRLAADAVTYAPGLVSLDAPGAVVTSGAGVSVAGARHGRVHAPGAARVLVDGAPVPFTSHGAWIEF